MQQGSVSSVKVGVRVRPLLSKERNQPVTISVNDSTSLQFKNSMGFNKYDNNCIITFLSVILNFIFGMLFLAM